ncbi:MAG TPA: hypothetical protein PLT66_04745 [Bacillota bacterium]|nr:hypothetical protein [Bacillota bacterium]
MDISKIDIKYIYNGGNSGYNARSVDKQSLSFVAVSQIISGTCKVSMDSEEAYTIPTGGFL